MKFSIVVPVYNVENYIIKCLESINKQSYDNYEVIIVNDGSTDNSEALIKKYIEDKNKFKYYKKENGGLSDARNFGVKYITGDYLLFVDSDDYIDEKLLEKLNDVLRNNNYEMVKFNIIDVINDKAVKHIEKLKESREVTFKELVNFSYFEVACAFCYQAKFYKEHKYQFKKGYYHEDFGLIPLILLDTKSIYYLNFYGYYYVKRENSIINDPKKIEKRVYDVLKLALENINIIKNLDIEEDTKALALNFYAVGAISRYKIYRNKDYLKRLKQEHIAKYLLNKTWKQKIKRLICMISYKWFIKLFLGG